VTASSETKAKKLLSEFEYNRQRNMVVPTLRDSVETAVRDFMSRNITAMLWQLGQTGVSSDYIICLREVAGE